MSSQRDKLEAMKKSKDYEIDQSPDNRIQYFMYKVAMHVSFDAVMNVLILFNLIPIIFELTADEDAPYLSILRIINYVYCSIYVLEALWKVRTIENILYSIILFENQ